MDISCVPWLDSYAELKTVVPRLLFLLEDDDDDDDGTNYHQTLNIIHYSAQLNAKGIVKVI